MRFVEIDLFGLYVAPIAVIFCVAWVAFALLRRATAPLPVLQHVWHPALFELALYVIIVSAIVLAVARWGH
jgi:protein AaeX